MSASEICFLTATELVRLVRVKELSALEVMETHLAQIERVNPEVNAIVTLTAEQAMDRARATDDAIARGEEVETLAGLPVAHKDLFPTEGVRTTFGSLVYRDFVPDHDALIVERLKGEGAISVGKTNTPEFGAGSQTFNQVFGETLNPYDPTRTCGGSSGGGAVALAHGGRSHGPHGRRHGPHAERDGGAGCSLPAVHPRAGWSLPVPPRTRLRRRADRLEPGPRRPAGGSSRDGGAGEPALHLRVSGLRGGGCTT